ncbi:MAG: hypothetical protein KBF42_03320 [Chitinophagales bacterium]|nr:hypothetical protein [Chitinophagales bacterium]
MKKWLLIIGITLGIISHTEVNAQIVKVNISSQPLWGPVGYNYVEYYYIPDCEVYYYVPGRTFYYYSGGGWLHATSLPGSYNCDLYSSYKVVINKPNPWLHHKVYVVKYAKYKTSPPRQYVIKDSDDSKYYVVEGHRNYKKPDETGVRTGEKGKDNGVNNDEQKRPSKSKVKEKKAKRKIKNN